MKNRYKSMPSMVIAEKEKTKDWCRQVLNSITNYMGAEGGSYHSSRAKDIRNYQIYNGVLSQGDYSYERSFRRISCSNARRNEY